MHKSTSGAVDDERNGVPTRVVSRLDVGRRVIVSGQFGGTLKYVGRIVGKDGIFCGIELDDPIGKHDGTHRNVSYFDCLPLHGIFAPTYKVELADATNSVDKPMPGTSGTSPRRPNSLIRSAIPALAQSPSRQQRAGALNGDFTSLQTSSEAMTSSTTSSTATASNDLWDAGRITHDPMNWSLMSGGSSMQSSGCSSNAIGGFCDDLMMNSNHTYVVTDSDYLMLDDIEINDPNLLHLDDDDEEDYNNNNCVKGLNGINQNDSVILEKPTMDKRLLPVIGSSSASECGDPTYEIEEEEAATPMVDGGVWRVPGIESEEGDGASNAPLLVTNHYSETLSVTTANRDSTDTPTSSESSTSAQNVPASESKKEKVDARSKTAEESARVTNAARKPNTRPAAAAAKSKKSAATAHEAPKRERPPKKPRVSLMEMIQQSAVPAAPRLPKPPSKSQMLMDRIKASIEADKHRPKKPIKSKVVESLQVDVASPTRQTPDSGAANVDTANDNSEPTTAPNEASSEKNSNENSEQENMVIIPAKGGVTAFNRSASGISTKSTQSRGVPANACGKTTSLSQRNGSAMGGSRPTGAAPTHQRPTYQTTAAGSGAAPRPATIARTKEPVKPVTTANTATTTSGMRVPLKARQIQPSTNNTSMALSHLDKKPTKPLGSITSRVASKPTAPHGSLPKAAANGIRQKMPPVAAKTTVARRNSLEIGLRRQMAWNAKAVDVLAVIGQWSRDDAERKHLQQLERLRADFAKELSDKCNELSTKLEDAEQARAQLAEGLTQSEEARTTLERRFADERAALVLRAEEAESSLETALAAKRELENTMAKDDNEKIQKLSNDISGLNFVLQQKTDELRKLRADNFQLQSEVDALKQTKIEVQKLQNRLDESKDQLKRQQNIQKDLVQQLERCREEAQNSIYMSKITEKENEVLKYKMQHLNEFTPVMTTGQFDEDDTQKSPHSSWKSLHCTTPVSSRTANNGGLRTLERRNSGGTARPNSTSVLGSQPLGYKTPTRTNGNGSIMYKSLDAAGMSALSVFQSQGRNGRFKNTPTKIYAPEGTFEINDQELLEDNNEHFSNKNSNGSTSDRSEDMQEDTSDDKIVDSDDGSKYVDFDATGSSIPTCE